MPDEATKDDDPKGPPPEEAPSALDEARKRLDPQDPPQDEADDDASEDEAEDLASPEAIARRVAALGEEDAIEVLARQEEAKLAERRKLQKKKKKGGLEAAASKRLSKIGARAPVKSTLPTPAEAAPLVERAVKLSEWAKKNQGTVSAFVGAALVVLGGVGAYAYYEKRQETQASVELSKAVADEKGRIGDPDKEDEEGRPHDPRPVFKTIEDRREAALKKYRAVESKFKGTGAAILARLEEGSLLLDKHDIPGATSAFNDVKSSPLAKADTEVNGRAIEGLGFAKELEADGQQGDARKSSLDDADKIYRELENTDVLGFQELAMYHQARVLEKQGDTSKAIELLKKLHERLGKPGDNHPFVYLEHIADDRLRALDPSALPAKAPGQLGGPGGNQLSQAQMRRMIEQAQKQQKGKTPGGPPGPPPGPQPEDLPP